MSWWEQNQTVAGSGVGNGCFMLYWLSGLTKTISFSMDLQTEACPSPPAASLLLSASTVCWPHLAPRARVFFLCIYALFIHPLLVTVVHFFVCRYTVYSCECRCFLSCGTCCQECFEVACNEGYCIWL